MRWPVMLAALVIAGCSTPYQDGVVAEKVTADTFRIAAKVNAFTPVTTIQDYTILKAAETTKAMGGTHFLIVSAAESSSTSYVATTYDPGTVHSLIKPGQDTYIRVLKVPPARAPPQGALSTDEIIFYVGSRVKGG